MKEEKRREMMNYLIVFSVPSARAAAFEEFKQTRGSNLNKIYLDNKEMVAGKKKQFAELARRVNQTKAEIDKTRTAAERKKNERLTMGKSDLYIDPIYSSFLGEFLNENGETIIDEEEYELISKLQELKGIYRTDFDHWKNLKSEISYSQNLVNQYQNRLVQGNSNLCLLSFSNSLSFKNLMIGTTNVIPMIIIPVLKLIHQHHRIHLNTIIVITMMLQKDSRICKKNYYSPISTVCHSDKLKRVLIDV